MINFFFFFLLFFCVSDNFTLSPLGVPPAVRWIVKGLSILITLPLSYTVKMDNYPKQLNKYIYNNLLNGIIKCMYLY